MVVQEEPPEGGDGRATRRTPGIGSPAVKEEGWLSVHGARVETHKGRGGPSPKCATLGSKTRGLQRRREASKRQVQDHSLLEVIAMSHVTRRLTPEQVWIARLFRSCCSSGKPLNTLKSPLHLPFDSGIGLHSSHGMTSLKTPFLEQESRQEPTLTEREKIVVPL